MMRALAPLAGLMLMTGCSLGVGGKPPAFLLTLTPTEVPAANAGKPVSASETMTIAIPLAPQAIASNRIPVTQGSVAIAYIKDAAWVEQPARLFQRLLSETVRARTGRTVLDPRQFSMEPGTLLSGQLLQFGIDENAARAVVVYEATLSNGSKAVRTRRFEARVPVGKIEPGNAGSALNRAANTVAGEVSDWVAAG